MGVVFYGANQVPLSCPGNSLLAHLQAATNRRFADGRGYFLSLSGVSNDGEPRCSSYWIHPAIPLSFSYETQDDTGESPGPVVIDQGFVDTLLAAMDRAIGVVIGFSDEAGRPFPFLEGIPDEPPAKSNHRETNVAEG
ncbi:hypothetical protein [[Mycobacterium] holstebronense]|uniref:DUF7882 domain-containing protein n=1 Tax=[Mycobacterium] holstebronense TaxID=3064288 RepID=A0ABN9NCR1_9MYCO|nr:hypothetical protein [Mycolicibacter sp. MU0102]CAJ1504254.1 hypothetical protein MU0102_002198 [Mycolicibacter sp. MU0102]